MKESCLDRERKAANVLGDYHSTPEQVTDAKEVLKEKLCHNCRNTFVQQYGYDDLLCDNLKELE